MTPTRASYGVGPRRYGEWWVPASTGPHPLVVLVHGGYWRPIYDASLEHDVARSLAAQGFLVWNVDYSPAGTPWPSTLLDVAAAYDHAVTDPRVAPGRVAVVGHSAGGHLALWLASRTAATPAGAPHVAPSLCVPQAPVACLALGWEQGLGEGAVSLFVGGSPASCPERYAEADPVGLTPQCRTVLLHGEDDEVVPIAQSETYVAATGAALVRLPGGHFEHLDPTSAAFAALLEALRAL